MAEIRDGFMNELRNLSRHAVTAASVYSDTVDLTVPDARLYIGSVGNVKVTLSSGAVVTFIGVPAGTFMPILIKRLWSTGSTAQLITDTLVLY